MWVMDLPLTLKRTRNWTPSSVVLHARSSVLGNQGAKQGSWKLLFERWLCVMQYGHPRPRGEPRSVPSGKLLANRIRYQPPSVCKTWENSFTIKAPGSLRTQRWLPPAGCAPLTCSQYGRKYYLHTDVPKMQGMIPSYVMEHMVPMRNVILI